MANWLESTTWDAATNDQAPELAKAAVPYVRVVDPLVGFL